MNIELDAISIGEESTMWKEGDRMSWKKSWKRISPTMDP